MTRQNKIDSIVNGWSSLHHTRKQDLCDNALHPCVAAHKNVPLKQIREIGDPTLRQSLPDILASLSDDAIDVIHAKFVELSE